MADLDRFARAAVARDHGSRAGDAAERIGAARAAIAVHLYTVPAPPHPGQLINTGRAACDRLVKQDWRAHGISQRNLAAGPGGMPGYRRYWTPGAKDPFDEMITDRLALTQIWPCLTPRQREALRLLAALGDYPAAAAAMGITVGTFTHTIATARRRFLTLWHAPEPPPARRGARRSAAQFAPATGPGPAGAAHGKASTYNHDGCRCIPCTTAATAIRGRSRRRAGARARRQITVPELTTVRRRKDNGETLTAIAADTGYGTSYLSRALRGLSAPAPGPPAEPAMEVATV